MRTTGMHSLIENMAQLIDLIGAGCHPKQRGPIVVQALIWDGRTVQAEYYRLGDDELPAIFSLEDPIMNNDVIRPHAQALVDEGKPFVTDVGESDEVCTLRWSIS